MLHKKNFYINASLPSISSNPSKIPRKLQWRGANLTTMFLQPIVVAWIPEEISHSTNAGQQICRNCRTYSNFLNHFH